MIILDTENRREIEAEGDAETRRQQQGNFRGQREKGSTRDLTGISVTEW